jgi:hypothetical protein
MPARTCWFMSAALTSPFLPSKRSRNESASTSKGSEPSSFSRTNSWVFDEIHLAEHPLAVEGRW